MRFSWLLEVLGAAVLVAPLNCFVEAVTPTSSQSPNRLLHRSTCAADCANTGTWTCPAQKDCITNCCAGPFGCGCQAESDPNCGNELQACYDTCTNICASPTPSACPAPPASVSKELAAMIAASNSPVAARSLRAAGRSPRKKPPPPATCTNNAIDARNAAGQAYSACLTPLIKGLQNCISTCSKSSAQKTCAVPFGKAYKDSQKSYNNQVKYINCVEEACNAGGSCIFAGAPSGGPTFHCFTAANA